MIIAQFAAKVDRLAPEQKLHFYELLSHNLTITIRSIWSDEKGTDSEKLEAIRAVNEIMHRVTEKVWVLRLNTHESTETDMQAMIEEYIADIPALVDDLDAAIHRSYEFV